VVPAACGENFSRVALQAVDDCLVHRDAAFTAVAALSICQPHTSEIDEVGRTAMRAEAQKVVTSIEEALVLLRRSL
jgi:hypothetical protein